MLKMALLSCKFEFDASKSDINANWVLVRLFMHGGHTNRVSDFSWNLNDPWVMVSAAEDNLIQCWKVSQAIVGRDDEDVADHELENV